MLFSYPIIGSVRRNICPKTAGERRSYLIDIHFIFRKNKYQVAFFIRDYGFSMVNGCETILDDYATRKTHVERWFASITFQIEVYPRYKFVWNLTHTCGRYPG